MSMESKVKSQKSVLQSLSEGLPIGSVGFSQVVFIFSDESHKKFQNTLEFHQNCLETLLEPTNHH